ncbi:hypothetical protein D8674_020527 [Pyrus ussuriensis x Pyrus communis]|uniref:Uncharacterized protein n=1 Tax=Pyrus ussuriensis x Pyrus communis TaxID=2448454 RepID=A0A5N5HFW6_9ROSA|nr:hypothetical protein D8674_020527 [Pyrus ussuriensis x Pyrus communis]
MCCAGSSFQAHVQRAQKEGAARGIRSVVVGPGDKDLGSRANMILSQSPPRCGLNSVVDFLWAFGAQ